MQIIFDNKEEAETFRSELFSIQTTLAKQASQTPEQCVLLIEKLYYLSNTETPILK